MKNNYLSFPSKIKEKVNCTKNNNYEITMMSKKSKKILLDCFSEFLYSIFDFICRHGQRNRLIIYKLQVGE